MLQTIYRYNSICNYLMNRWRFKKLRCGKNVTITCHNQSHFSFENNVWLAEGTRIDILDSHTSVHLKEGVNICRNSMLSPGKSGITIGKRTKLQESCRLLGEVTIGDDVIIAPNFYISSGIHVFNKEPYLLVSLQDQIHNSFGEHCTIEDDCWIGMNVCVMPGVRISRGCIIGAGAIVTRSTEPYGIYGGVPAKKIGSRLILLPKYYLNAMEAENLPYFYRGFDHYHYPAHKNKYKGISTNAGQFSLFTELTKVTRIQLILEPLQPARSFYIQHNDTKIALTSGNNSIIMNNIKTINKLITFVSESEIIVKEVTFFDN